ncbi:MAG: hypothetical protein O2907_07800 [Proteobacteria bacterium]|nr:hypothetical protein [Pseudomonadota bacterium]
MRYAMVMPVVLFLLVIFPFDDSYGDAHAYECIVLTEQDLGDDGHLRMSKLAAYKGKAFHVDRASGTILGPVWSNSGHWQKTVLGNGEYLDSFKVLSVSQANLATYLVIREFADGRIKPFVFVIGDMVLTGTCE